MENEYVRYQKCKKTTLDNVEPLLNKYYPNILDATYAIKQFPANVTLFCHGDQSEQFQWNNGQWIHYSDLFDMLPRKGIDCITILSCKGSTAAEEKMLRSAPPGAVVLTLSANEFSVSYMHINDFLTQTRDAKDPITYFLKILDNFDPVEYYKLHQHLKHIDVDPIDAVPRIIGIGGVPPKTIHLDEEVTRISARNTADGKPLDKSAWKRAVKRMHATFNTEHHVEDPQNPGEYYHPPHNEAAEAVLHKSIDKIAEKIREGSPLGKEGDRFQNAEELRLAYALTAAYLDESGQIAKWRQATCKYIKIKSNVNTRVGAVNSASLQALAELEALAKQRKNSGSKTI